jgi:hypothetical protein
MLGSDAWPDILFPMVDKSEVVDWLALGIAGYFGSAELKLPKLFRAEENMPRSLLY